MVAYWQEHEENFQAMIEQLLSPETLGKLAENSGSLTCRLNVVMKCVPEKYNSEVIAPVYARMAQLLCSGEKHVLLMAMQGFFETLHDAKDRVDASLGDLFCEEAGRMRMLPFLQMVFPAGFDEKQALSVFVPQLTFYWLRYLHVYDGSMKGNSVEEALEEAHQQRMDELQQSNAVKRVWDETRGHKKTTKKTTEKTTEKPAAATTTTAAAATTMDTSTAASSTVQQTSVSEKTNTAPEVEPKESKQEPKEESSKEESSKEESESSKEESSKEESSKKESSTVDFKDKFNDTTAAEKLETSKKNRAEPEQSATGSGDDAAKTRAERLRAKLARKQASAPPAAAATTTTDSAATPKAAGAEQKRFGGNSEELTVLIEGEKRTRQALIVLWRQRGMTFRTGWLDLVPGERRARVERARKSVVEEKEGALRLTAAVQYCPELNTDYLCDNGGRNVLALVEECLRYGRVSYEEQLRTDPFLLKLAEQLHLVNGGEMIHAITLSRRVVLSHFCVLLLQQMKDDVRASGPSPPGSPSQQRRDHPDAFKAPPSVTKHVPESVKKAHSSGSSSSSSTATAGTGDEIVVEEVSDEDDDVDEALLTTADLMTEDRTEEAISLREGGASDSEVDLD